MGVSPASPSSKKEISRFEKEMERWVHKLLLEHLQNFCKTTPYFDFLAKRGKISSNNLVKELLKNKKVTKYPIQLVSFRSQEELHSAPHSVFFSGDQSKMDA